MFSPETTILAPVIDAALPSLDELRPLSLGERAARSLQTAAQRSFRVSFTYDGQRHRLAVPAHGPTDAVLAAVHAEEIGAPRLRGEVCAALLAAPALHALVI